MTKLESELLEAIITNTYIETSGEMTDVEKEAVSKAAAEVAKRYIEKAYHDGQNSVNTQHGEFEETFEEWSKENGIV